ncbi:hypothetical protein PtA15_10A696 [Puccinia triticina]|uniref:Uncharacterized protein n=1 Tax=Puccinia triticina TaxID=208348 RepID=A0ABY7CXU8_9BASI|nr:uncharacterized protein PtA15_10A696 [Puccinia triticina]WAQ89272.1 hypothetical protein PtA15_10A696 [Puccinia triticina]
MQNSHHQRHQNPSRLKSLTENLRLRLKYAKLKVLNGWHHQTLNEIEKTFYYLKLPKQQPSKTQQHSSPSTTTTISSRNSTQDPSDEQQQPVPSSALRSSTNTTFSLPSKYSTPFRKIIRAGGTASGQLTTNESNIFWPTGPGTTTSSKRQRKSPEGLFFKLGGSTTDSSREREDLFKDSMDEYKELYKHSSPASFLFNNHYRPLRASTLLRLAASELVSPSPNRSHSHLNKIFASNSRPTLSPNNDQNHFSLHPRPPRLSSNPARDPPPHTLLDHEDVEETAAGVDQIGLDELDQMNWE